MKRLLVLLFLMLLIISPSTLVNASRNEVLHPVHNTLLEIEYDQDSSTWQVMLKVFVDDLEVGYNQEKGKDWLLNENLLQREEHGIAVYLSKHIRLRTTKAELLLDFVGYESEGGHDLWYYFESKGPQGDGIKVMNTLFLEHFSDQKNFVNVKVGESKQSGICNAQMKSLEFEY